MSLVGRAIRMMVLAAVLLGVTNAAYATHYPAGASCMDCHALGYGQVISGTKLIRSDDFLTTIGFTSGTLPCLFCHRSDRGTAGEMAGVEAHFGGTTASKHRILDLKSGFEAPATADGLDCVDCHSDTLSNFRNYVIGDGSGNATIHGINAKLADVDVDVTLVDNGADPNPLNDGNYTNTCQATTCHGTLSAEVAYGGSQKARKQHGMAGVTLGSTTTVPTSCNQCHSSHRSDSQPSLLILQDNGTASQTGTSPVTANECGGCHTQDNGGASSDWQLYGHGMATSEVTTGALGYACTACHSAAVPHAFGMDAGSVTNPMRFSLTENTSEASAMRLKSSDYTDLPGNVGAQSAYSICGNCHQAHDNNLPHGNSTTFKYAGCNDCHEPHGTGVNYGGTANDLMIRRQMPKIDATGAAVSSPWEEVTYIGNRVSGKIVLKTSPSFYFSGTYVGEGVCDSQECHEGVTVAGDLIYPLATFTTGGRHSGGNFTADDACIDCHQHNDSTGSMGTQDSCVSCHGQPPASAATASSGYTTYDELKTPHAKHAAVYGGTASCSQCHPALDGTTHDTTPVKTYQTVTFANGLGNTAADSYNTGSYLCSSVYCHSDGAGVYTNPTWNAANWDTTNLSCAGCHKGIDAGATQIASNAHDAHLASGITCNTCHYTTITGTGTDTTAVANGAAHANGSINVAANTTTTFHGTAINFTWNDAGNTCTALTCHSATLLWTNASVLCSDCHSDPTNDVNSYNGQDGILSKISTAEYSGASGRGHGTAAIVGTGKACADCHDKAVGHDFSVALNGSNPFRLKDLVAGGGLDFTCMDNVAGCHTSATATNEAALGLTYGMIVNHTDAAMGADSDVTNWGFTPKCVDCHDPHGDAANVKMIQKDLWDNGSAGTTIATAVPTSYTTIGNTNVVFTTYTTGQTAAGSAYAQTGSVFSSICQECHETAEAGFTAYKDGVNADASPHPTAPGDCSGCHKHDSGFKPSGCNGCHGGHNATVTNVNYWPDGITVTGRPNRPGKHDIHIQRLALKLGIAFTSVGMTDANQKTICAYCHTGVMGEGGHDDAATPANVGSFDRIWNGAVDAGVAATYTAGGEGLNGICAGVDCHNEQTTTPNYDWYDTPAASACIMCHTAGGAGSNPASGLHAGPLTVSNTPHDDSFAGTGNCTTCHTNFIPYTVTTHLNGTFPVNDTGAGTNEYSVTLAGYTDAAVNAVTCSGAGVSAANCHGIDPIDAGSWVRKWSTTAKNSDGTECANCHGGFVASDWTFGSAASTVDYQVSHDRDWDGAVPSEVIGNHSGSTQATRCQSCHVYPDAPYVWGTNHRDRRITMNSTMGYSGTTFLCSTSCHAVNTNHNLEAASSAAYATRANTLAGPPITCGQCHQSGVKIGMATGAHSIHGANDTDISGNSGADCAVCHGATGTYTSTLGTPVAHGNGSIDWTAGVSYNGVRPAVTGTCTTTTCHNKAADRSEAWNATQLLCNDCHGDATGGLSTSHTDHFTKGAVCGDCHLSVAAGDTTHINGGTTSLADKATAAQDEASVVFTDPLATQDYTFVDGDNSCHTPNPATGLACHATGGSAGAADPTRPIWGTAIGNLDCTNYCHTNNTLATVNPVSGLHSGSPAPTVSGKAHDEALVVATKCTVCHNILIGTATHLNGTFTGDTVANLALVAGVGYTQAGVANNGYGSCSGAVSPLNGTTCHGPAGSGDAGTWARLWDSSISYQALGTNPENVANSVCDGCHGTFAGGWTTGTAANTTDGQVEHGRNWDGDGSAEVAANHGDPKDCMNCHVLGDAAYPTTTNAAHRNNQITMNSDASSAYNSTNWYCATTCHGTVGHNLEDSGFTTVQSIDGPGATCVGCHKAEGGGSATAPKVIWSNGSATTGATAHDTVYGSHLKTATAEVLNSATNFDTQCLKCHQGHSGGYTITLPPTAYSNGVIAAYNLQTTLAIDYTTNGGIHLGGTSTPTTTSEAVICWNCHGTAISEWGSNSNVLTGTSTYDYGTLKTVAYTGSATADWVAGIWHSANGLTASSQIFGYKQGATKSIHSANPTAGTQTVSGTLYSAMSESKEGVADIRCSYCHDVHNHVTKTGATVGPSGQPYLRGTYIGNKYREDGAPHSSITYSNSAQYGAVPRGVSANQLMGGYFIDQNSANPTSTINVTGAGATAAGLCELCHGSGDGTWTAGELATIDYKTGEGLWISSNGHGNSVKQATKSTAAANNIFDFTHGRPTPISGTGSAALTSQVASQGMIGQGSNDGYSYRGNDSSTYNGMYAPGVPVSGNGLPAYDWGATVDAGTVNSTFHNFICSKCHNPHASRLPKLMITNCLDINHNTWDDAKTSQTRYTRTYLVNGVSTRLDRNKKMAYFSSAQNCHRRDDHTLVTPALNPGWNKVTPW